MRSLEIGLIGWVELLVQNWCEWQEDKDNALRRRRCINERNGDICYVIA